MKAALVAIAAVALFGVAPVASGFERPPELQRAASVFALRGAEVRCPSNDECVHDPIWGLGPNPSRAWGYTDMIENYIVLHPLLCAGALAVADPSVPAWQRATGVLVLVHEAYHLRRWPGRRNEAKVECQAIRHFTAGAAVLGASSELANELLPYALAAHAQMVRRFPDYGDGTCELPLWVPPSTP
jgi:hypothetical protein